MWNVAQSRPIVLKAKTTGYPKKLFLVFWVVFYPKLFINLSI